MGTMAPPLPPDIVRQQSSPEEAQSVFAANGLNQPSSPQGAQQLQQLQQLLQEGEQYAKRLVEALQGYDPSLVPILQPMFVPLAKLQETLNEKAKRGGVMRGSSVVPPNAPPNPAAGPPTPAGM